MPCMVLFCKTRGSTPGITYFRLTSRRHDAWLNALGRDPSIERLSDTNRICSIHFLPDDFTQKGGKLVLKLEAIPTQHLGIQRNQRPLLPIQDQTNYNEDINSGGSIVNEMSKSINDYGEVEEQIVCEKMEIKLEENQENGYGEVEEQIVCEKMEIKLEEIQENQQFSQIEWSPTTSSLSQSTTTVDSVGDFLEFHGILYLIFVLLGLYLCSSKKEEYKIPTISEPIRNIKHELITSSTSDSEGFRGPIKKARN